MAARKKHPEVRMEKSKLEVELMFKTKYLRGSSLNPQEDVAMRQ